MSSLDKDEDELPQIAISPAFVEEHVERGSTMWTTLANSGKKPLNRRSGGR